MMRTPMSLHVSTVWVLVWLGSLTFLPAAAFSASSSPQPSGAVLHAEILEYMRAEKRIVATGAVTLVYGQTRLFADRVELYTETGVGSAWGQVRLLTPEDDLQASRLDFELSSERGILYDAVGVVDRSYRVTGERIVRLGPGAFTVYDGRVTTCTGTVPDWEFRVREAHVGLGDSVTLKHPSFWIKGIPVFYVPYLVLPLHEERTTGFLPPHVGGSRRDGGVAGTEFFWAMTDWMDATLGLEYLSQKGWRPTAEFRYAIDPESDGQMRGSFIHEQDTGADRWKVTVQQRQEFGWGVRGLTQLDLRSKRDLDRAFSRDLSRESVVQTDSFVALNKRFPDSALSMAGDVHQAVRDSGSEETFRRLPSLRFTHFPTSLLNLAFFALEASYTQLSDTEGVDNRSTQRLDVFPQLTLPIALPPWMHLAVSGGVRETFYDRGVTGASNISRELVDLRAHLQGPLLWRRYGGTKGKPAFIHLVEPQVAYRYVPRVDQDEIPPFETLDEAQHFLDPLENLALVDRIAAANYVKLSLLQRLFIQGGGAGLDATGAREVMRVVVSQGLDMRASAASEGRLLGPLDIELEMHFRQQVWLTSTVRLAPSRGELQESNWRLQVAIRPGWLVYVANRYRRAPDLLYVSGGMQVTLYEGLEMGYTWRYDGRLERFREHQVTLSYLAQCWRLDMRFRWRESGDTAFFIRFNVWPL